MGTDDQPAIGLRIVDIEPTNTKDSKHSVGGLELDGWAVDNWWDDFYGVDQRDCGMASCIGWDMSGYPLLCDSCIRSVGLNPGWDSNINNVSGLGVLNNCKSMETETMMADLLGTAWWSILCVSVGFGFGLWSKSWIMQKLGK